ncbi:MAG: hypothetical protein AAF391_03475 [Bacteroidota bacterium]
MASDSSIVWAQELDRACDQSYIAQGEELYNAARYNEVIELLEPCLPVAIEDKKLQEGFHRLVILSYYYRENDEQARIWTESLLKVNRNYRVPDGDPKYFLYAVEALRPKPPKPWHRRWAYRAPILGALGGGVAYLLFKPEPTIPLKPLPPATPGL